MGLGIKVFIDNTNKLFAAEINTLVKQLDKMISFTGSRRINDNTNQLAGALDDATKRLVYHNSSTSNDTLVLIRKDVNDAIEVLEDDYVVMFYVNGSNTTAVTLKVNALPSKVLEFNGSALEPGTLKVGTLYSALYSTVTGKFSLYITGGNGGVITDPSNYKAGIVYTGDSSGLNKILLPKNLSYVGATSGNYLVTLPKVTTGVFFIELLVYNDDKVDRLIVKMDSSNTGITYSSQNTVNDTIPLLAPLVTDVGVVVGTITVKVGLVVVTSSSSSLVVSSVYTMDTIDRRKVETESKFEKVVAFPTFDSSFETLKNLDVSGDTRGVNGIPDSHVTGSIKHNENINSSKYDSISTSTLFGGEISYIKTIWDDGRGRAIADIVYQEAFEPKAGTKAYRYGNPDGSMSAWAYTMNLLSDYANKIATLATGYKLRISNNLSINTTATGNLNTTKALAIGDGGTGFRQNGLGVLEYYCDNVKVLTFTKTGLDATVSIKENGTLLALKYQPRDSNTVVDASYVHTDNNFTAGEKDKLATVRLPVSSNVTVNVGAGEINKTINDAIDYITGKWLKPVDPDISVTISLNAGFVMADKLMITRVDLSWIAITGVDDETVIDCSSMVFTVTYSSIFYALYAKLPRIEQLFRMQSSTTPVTGISLYYGSYVKVKYGAGIIGCSGYGIAVFEGSHANIEGAKFMNATKYAIYLSMNATCDADTASVDGCLASPAIYLYGSSELWFTSGSCLTGNNVGIQAYASSKASCGFSNFDQATCYSVSDGSVIMATWVTGLKTSNQVLNTVTSNGIIYG